MIPTSEVLETDRLRLRLPAEADFDRVWSASRVPGFNDGMRWDPPETMDALRSEFEKSITAWTEGTFYSFTIECKNSLRCLGRVGIRREHALDEWSIGFWVHPDHQGLGIAREAAQAMIELGFNRLGAKRISAAHATWNVASKKVLEAIGMKFVGLNPRGYQKRGEWVEAMEYEILP